MFEHVVCSIVEYYAFKYVNGVRPEALKINLWAGNLVLDNIELNTKV
jgi:hypothetical protein